MKFRIDKKALIPHLVSSLILMAISVVYFYPALQGYSLDSHDTKQHKGMSKEVVDFRSEFGSEPLWTNSMFGGMPADQISVRYDSNLVSYIYDVYTFGIPRPISYLWTLFIGFYILLLCLKVDPWISLVASIAFGFSSFFMISLQAGHMSKVNALGFMAPTIGSFVLLFRGKLLQGGILAVMFLSLELWAGHPQIVYYTFFIIMFVGIYFIYQYILKKEWRMLGKVIGISSLVVLLGIGSSLASLWSTFEYGRETIRGKSDLTLETPVKMYIKQMENPDSPISKYREAKNGLDEDYILAWSYGTGETFTFMFPNLKGGGNNYEPYNTKTLSTLYPSEFEEFQNNVNEKLATTNIDEYFNNINYENQQYIFPQLNTLPEQERGYFGQQGLTNGPVFIGIILCFLSFLALIISDGKYNYILLGVSVLCIILAYAQLTGFLLIGLLGLIVLSILNNRLVWHLFTILIITVFLSWGKNFIGFSEFFINYFPLYNKFRSVTMILVVAELIIPLIAGLFLYNVVKNREKLKENIKVLYIGAGVFGFLTLIVAISPSVFFEIPNEVAQAESVANTLKSNKLDNVILQSDEFFNFYGEELYNLRESVIKKDAWKGLFFIAAIFGLIFLYINQKIEKVMMLTLTGILLLVEMVPVAVTYLNNEKDESGDFIYWAENSDELQPYEPNNGDLEILTLETQAKPELNTLISNKLTEVKNSSDEILTLTDQNIVKLSVLNANTNYRVFSRLRTDGLTSSTRTSYFHKSLGGYHGAKLMRYQELVDFHIEPRVTGANELVLDMLNTKYIIGEFQGPDGKPIISSVERESALGAAWIVSGVTYLDSANQEMEALSVEKGFDPANVAILNSEFKDVIGDVSPKDPTSSIVLDDYKPNKLMYTFNSSKEEFVVFSEIYYQNGWQAYIDDVPVDHVRVNYLLRGLKVPQGSHKITFEFSRKSYSTGSLISLISSLIVIGLILYLLFLTFFKEPRKTKEIIDGPISL